MMGVTLLPGYKMVSSSLRPSSSPHQPRKSFVSARSLVRDCPTFLSAETHEDHLDRDTWLQSYQEEKQGLRYYSVYTLINREEYFRL